jgi:8-oxo-dGTP pyrophosphatase MutT (NUDIX family)
MLMYLGKISIPKGPWWVNPEDESDMCNPADFPSVKDFDDHGRPLHPWYREMIKDPRIGVVAGKGKLFYYGPNNETADSNFVRYDLREPHTLLIERASTNKPAFPGGFIDEDETPEIAALRETHEETKEPRLDFRGKGLAGQVVYVGPVVDLRLSIHSWQVGHSIRFDLPIEFTEGLPVGPCEVSGSEINNFKWVPISKLPNNLHGSHNFLAEMAFGAKR